MRKRFFLIVGCGVILGAGWLFAGLRPIDSGDHRQIIVSVGKGQSVASIGAMLKDKNLVRSPLAFTWYVRLLRHTRLQAGVFPLSRSQSVLGIVQTLETGKSQEISITIPEGFTVEQIDELMASKGLGERGDILRCAFDGCDFSSYTFLPAPFRGPGHQGFGSILEGYLFPDTYFINVAEYQPKFLMERMLNAFRNKILEGHAADLKASKRSLSDVIKMASLIEEEARGDDERAMISGILWKRFDARTTLGVDAALRYKLGKIHAPLTQDDLTFDTPYNTRLFKGLPPTPIANPGESSIVASLRPKSSNYWYYLHDSSGTVHYAVTNDEHNQNRAKYLR